MAIRPTTGTTADAMLSWLAGVGMRMARPSFSSSAASRLGSSNWATASNAPTLSGGAAPKASANAASAAFGVTGLLVSSSPAMV